MADSKYTSVLSREAIEFIVAQGKRKQIKLLDLVDRLTANPFRISDIKYILHDDRTVESVLIEEFVLTYWVDHAAKEIRVIDIVTT